MRTTAAEGDNLVFSSKPINSSWTSIWKIFRFFLNSTSSSFLTKLTTTKDQPSSSLKFNSHPTDAIHAYIRAAHVTLSPIHYRKCFPGLESLTPRDAIQLTRVNACGIAEGNHIKTQNMSTTVPDLVQTLSAAIWYIGN